MTELEYLTAWTAEAASHLSGPDQPLWSARIESRLPEIFRTFDRYQVEPDESRDGALRILINLQPFWIRSVRTMLALEWLRRLLPASPNPTALRADVLLCRGRMQLVELRFADAMSTSLEARHLFVQLGNAAGVSSAVDLYFAAESRTKPPAERVVREAPPLPDILALVDWTAEAASHLSGPDQTIWSACIEARLAQILLTFARCQSLPGSLLDASLRIIVNLEPFWGLSVRTKFGLEWLRRLLPFSLRRTALRADALLCQARLQRSESRLADARTSIEEAGAIYRDLGDAAGVAVSFDLYCDAESRTNPAPERDARTIPPMLDIAALAEWTAEAACHLAGPDQAAWLARIDERLPEIVFTIHPGHLRRNDHIEASLRIAINLGHYWWMRGRGAWARTALNELLPLSGTATPLLADGLLALAGLDYAEARYEDVKRSCIKASASYQTLANNAGLAAALNQLGMAEREAGELTFARGHHEEARALYLGLGDERGAVACLSNLGVVALFEGNLDVAETFHEGALAERRRLGDVRGIASSLGSLGTIARLRGDTELASEMHEEALGMRRDLADPWGVAGSLVNLGLIAIQSGDLARASDLIGEATAGFTKVGDRLGICETLDARALLTFAEDLPAEAVRLFAVAHRAREDVGAPLPPVYRKEADRVLEKCKARVGGKAFDAAWKAGLSPQYSPFPLTPAGVP